jgi:hypothetical protein
MRASEFIPERRYTDLELRQRGWDGSEEDREWFDDEIPNGKASTRFSVIAAIGDILGWDNLYVDEEQDDFDAAFGADNAIFVNTSRSGLNGGRRGTFQRFDAADGGGMVINLAFPAESHDARDVGTAVHEAFHAKIALGSRGNLYVNEQLVNKMAEKWLRAHLTGIELHVALEGITKSRISYRHTEL